MSAEEDYRTTLALTRVLFEAGETDLAVEWMKAETRQLYLDACRIADDPEADPGKRRRAEMMRDGLAALVQPEEEA
jgi:hypothetical protein